MCKLCSINGCKNEAKAKGMCFKHYRQAQRGKLKSEENIEKQKEIIKEITKQNGYVLQKKASNIGKTTKYEIICFDNGTQSIVEKTSDFVTKEGNMRIPELKEQELVYQYVDKEYCTYALLLLQWATNNKDCLIKNPETGNKLIANDLMLKEFLSRFAPKGIMSDRKYKEVINHLIEKGIIYKTTRKTILDDNTVVYMANPLFFYNKSCELTPEAFLCFHNILATKIKRERMNEMVGLCLKSLAWNNECAGLISAGNTEEANNVFKNNLDRLVLTLGLQDNITIYKEEIEEDINKEEVIDKNYEEDIIALSKKVKEIEPKEIVQAPVKQTILTEDEIMEILEKKLIM